jgi:predicted nucleotidyltransferase
MKNLSPLMEIARKIFARASRVDYAFIFGSVLKRPGPQSDIDFLVGGKLGFADKAELSYQLAMELKKKIDIVLVEETSCEVAMKAFSRGKKIVAPRPQALKKDYFRKYCLFEQTNGLRDLKLDHLRRRYENGRPKSSAKPFQTKNNVTCLRSHVSGQKT